MREGNLPELDRLLDRAQAARRNVVRVFGSWFFIGGGLAPYSPTDAAWFEWMDVVLEHAAARGLYVELSYACDWQQLVPDRALRRLLFQRLAAWAKTKLTLIVTGANEARKNGWSEADDPELLELCAIFIAESPDTPFGVSDPLDTPPNSVEGYNASQKAVALLPGVDFLLVHPARKDRFEWVNHLYGAAQTPGAVGFIGVCWIQEPMGGASRDVPGRRDSSMVAHVAAACVGAMAGGHTYMHRQLEDDVAPGLLESAAAADIPGSPDYRFYNSGVGGSPVARFDGFAGGKCRCTWNGSDGWAVAYGETDGSVTPVSNVAIISSQQWQDAHGTCWLLHLAKV